MTDARNEYIRALFTLSKSDPRAWEEFMAAFNVYTQEELERALRTPVMEAQVALGMSRRIVDIRDDCRNIVALMVKVGGFSR